MPILAATNLRVHYGPDIILDGVSLSVEPGERIGIVGRNGGGKSTLLKALAGVIRPDTGEVIIQKGKRVGYLKQDPELDPEESLRDAAEGAFAELHHLHRQLHKVFDQMASAQGDDLDRLLRDQERLEARIESAGGYAIDHKIDATLHGLGFTDSQFAIRCADLSGGQRARLALARLLLEAPDALLLDEPTNHLDIEGCLWLETFLKEEYAGAVLMVSHDRYLLDNVVDRIVEVEFARLIDYPGSYSAFREIRAQRRLTQQRAYEKQQTEFKRQEAYIRKYKTGQRAKEAKGRQSKLDRQREQAIERPMELSTLSLSLPKAPRSGDQVITARRLGKRYENIDHRTGERIEGEDAQKVLFHDLDLTVSRGERWGIIGPNGAGKSTLARCLLGEQESDDGFTKIGSNVLVGHFKQTSEGVDPELSVHRYIQREVKRNTDGAVELSEQQSRDLAGAFLFSGSEQDKEMLVLSGGETSRCRLAALIASAKNLLVLDEPTNHLDIPSAERLEEALSLEGGYTGTVLLISHDRALIDAVCDHVIALDGAGEAEIVIGNYTDWRERHARRQSEAQAEFEAQREEERRKEKQRKAQQEAQKAKQAPQAKSTSNAQRLLERMSMEQLEQKIEELETGIAQADAQMNDPDVWRDGKKMDRISAERRRLTAELEPLEFEWSRRAEAQ
ncbi:MAG: ATP-binding cassette domain-containing protein [Phycisphaeraceae bacterium]|nr:ATP-binding cassette domain-containing protein [Phycisphaeraceae bacterium]MCB9846994.1 ATP-binding cassette domain-containing protein [Phycisphaeraceae bacterium]